MKKYFLIFITLMVFLLGACSKSNNEFDEAINKDENVNNITYTKEQEDFLEKLKIVQKLEDAAAKYIVENNSTSNASFLALCYIRNIRYRTGAWNVVAGILDQDFVKYINENYVELKNEIYKMSTILDAFTDEKIDFIHLCATLNTAIYSNTQMSQDLSGWGGDLVQFCSAIKAKKEKLSYFATNRGSFNRMDINADMDSVNIYKIYQDISKKSIYEAMVEYYTSLYDGSRKKMFISNLGMNDKSIEEQEKYLFTRIKLNTYLRVLNETYDLSFDDDSKIFKDVIFEFVKYIND